MFSFSSAFFSEVAVLGLLFFLMVWRTLVVGGFLILGIEARYVGLYSHGGNANASPLFSSQGEINEAKRETVSKNI